MSMDREAVSREAVDKARQGIELLSEFLEEASEHPNAFNLYFEISAMVNKIDAKICAEEVILDHPDVTDLLAAHDIVKNGKGNWADRNQKTVDNFQRAYSKALTEAMGLNN